MKKRVNGKRTFGGRLLVVALAAVLAVGLCACWENGSGNGGK